MPRGFSVRARRRMLENGKPICVECGQMGVLADGRRVQPSRPDRANKLYFLCPCGAFVRCHDGTAVAMGRPGGPQTRQLRHRAHVVFDAIWQRSGPAHARSTGVQRKKAYAWLARELGIRVSDCHMANFDGPTCRRVIALCQGRMAA